MAIFIKLIANSANQSVLFVAASIHILLKYRYIGTIVRPFGRIAAGREPNARKFSRIWQRQLPFVRRQGASGCPTWYYKDGSPHRPSRTLLGFGIED